MTARGRLGQDVPDQRGQHVKMFVTDGVTTHECVWWNAGNGALPVGNFDLAFAPSVNEFNGRRAVQLKVLDCRPA